MTIKIDKANIDRIEGKTSFTIIVGHFNIPLTIMN